MNPPTLEQWNAMKADDLPGNVAPLTRRKPRVAAVKQPSRSYMTVEVRFPGFPRDTYRIQGATCPIADCGSDLYFSLSSKTCIYLCCCICDNLRSVFRENRGVDIYK